VKAPLALAILGLTVASALNAYSNRWRIADPDRTLRWRPDDSVALTLRQDQRQALVPLTPEGAIALAETARRALRSDPLSAPALRQIAVAEGMANRPAASYHLLRLSHRVTRRDLGTSWLLIEAGLETGDTAAILPYFDEALTTNLIAPDLLFPALTAALFDSALRAGLVPYVRQVSVWMPGFLRYAITSEGTEANVADLVLRAGGLPRVPLYSGLDARILNSLAERGEFALAGSYLRGMLGGSGNVATDIRVTPATTNGDLGLFGWTLYDQEELSAQREEDGQIGVRVAPDQQGRVALRTLMLPPGRYRLEQRLSTPSGIVPARGHWELVCLPARAGGGLWSLDMPPRAEATYVGTFEIPMDCPAQQLALSVRNDGDQGDAGLLVSLALTRL